MLTASFFVALALVIWFKTDAFNEYAKLLNLGDFFYLNEFHELEAGTFSYPEFLYERNPCFFTKLISCPICSSVWLGAISSIFAGIQFMPVITILGLLLYLVIDKLL